MKKCTKCHLEKDLCEFNKNTDSKDGFSYQCKKCNLEQHKIFRKKYPEIAKARDERYRKKHKEKINLKDKIRYVRDYKKKLVRGAKNRAKKEGLPFDLTENDIYIPDICPVFGYPLEIGVNKKKVQPNSPSLDRIIPERGYVKSNIRVISYKANIMKNNASFEEMIKIGEDGKRLQLQEAKKNE
jgi:hypothetical protein